MTLPPQLVSLVEDSLARVQEHPEHHLLPFQRLEIYDAIIAACTSLRQSTTVIGWTALFAAQRVVHLWDKIVEIKVEKYGPPDDTVLQGLVDPLRIHYIMLEMCESLLKQEADIEEISTEASNLWYVVGNEEIEIELILEERGILNDIEQARPYWQAHDALAASLHAIHHALGTHFLRPESLGTDDEITSAKLDTAGLAMRAECGGDARCRLAFWEWWLNTTLSQAWARAASG